MYPDQRDVELAMRNLIVSPRPVPEDIWPDVVLARSFLDESRARCFNYGRHRFCPAPDIKKIAESYIGRSISDYAVTVAVKMQSLETRPSKIDPKQFNRLTIKFPPLDRFEEARSLWNQHQRDLEQEIAHEKIRLDHEKAIRAKYL